MCVVTAPEMHRQVDQTLCEVMTPMKLLNCPCAAELVSSLRNVRTTPGHFFFYFWQAETPDGCGLLHKESLIVTEIAPN